MRRPAVMISIATALSLIWVLSVEAAPIKYDFTGTLTTVVDVPGVSGGLLIPGLSTFSGTIVYDTVPTSSTTLPGLAYHDFYGMPYGITIDVAGLFTDQSNPLPNPSFDLRQRVLNTSSDAITFYVADRQSIEVNGNVLGPDLGINGFRINLQRSGGDLFDSTELVTVLPALSDLNAAGMTLRYRVPGTSGTDGVFQLTGNLDTLSPAAVPEPSTLLLIVTGLVGMAAFRKRRAA